MYSLAYLKSLKRRYSNVKEARDTVLDTNDKEELTKELNYVSQLISIEKRRLRNEIKKTR